MRYFHSGAIAGFNILKSSKSARMVRMNWRIETKKAGPNGPAFLFQIVNRLDTGHDNGALVGSARYRHAVNDGYSSSRDGTSTGNGSRTQSLGSDSEGSTVSTDGSVGVGATSVQVVQNDSGVGGAGSGDGQSVGVGTGSTVFGTVVRTYEFCILEGFAASAFVTSVTNASTFNTSTVGATVDILTRICVTAGEEKYCSNSQYAEEVKFHVFHKFKENLSGFTIIKSNTSEILKRLKRLQKK